MDSWALASLTTLAYAGAFLVQYLELTTTQNHPLRRLAPIRPQKAFNPFAYLHTPARPFYNFDFENYMEGRIV